MDPPQSPLANCLFGHMLTGGLARLSSAIKDSVSWVEGFQEFGGSN